MNAGDVELGTPRSVGEQAVMVACYVMVLGVGILALVRASYEIGDFNGPWTTGRVVVLACEAALGLWSLKLALWPTSHIYHLWDRVFAGPSGVRAGMRGRVSYAWTEISGFEIDADNRSKRPRCIMVLQDGRRMTLSALREVDDGAGNPINPGAVEADAMKLRRMLDEARGTSPDPASMGR